MMDCKAFALLLDTPWEKLTQAQRDEMEQHAAQCPDCALALQIQRDMQGMDADETVPEAFSQGWRTMIREEERRMNEQNEKRRFPWKRALATAAAVIFVAGGTAISTLNGWGMESGKPAAQYRMADEPNYQYNDSRAQDYDYAAGVSDEGGMMLKSMAQNESASSAAPEEATAQASKIIRTVNFTIRTQQDDAAYAALSTLVSNYGGTVESLNLSGDQSAGSLRRANLTLRIPSEKLDAFVAGANDIGGVSNYSESSDDVRDTYYDLQSRLDTQKTKMARLLQLMEKAETTSDLIELENAISDTQYMIDSYTGRLNGYDSRVNNSYVYVTIRELSNAEAVEEENTPLGQRIANAVKASLEAAGRAAQGFAVFFVAALPWLAALGVAIVIIRVIRKKTKKQRK